ncbi:tyrosine-type recombinase/integrase [Streptomyces sp. NBC_00322]|uniref:site-specific integrase n=1 Tax=Streptomyces sp. NBC_00322 TaxID=2975712 RepID=UPI002E287707|nr:site-specific integrase [Streptomyces sp. NBC_00322]
MHGTGKRYAVRWRDESRRERRKSFTLKGDADKFAAKTTHELERGQYIDPDARKTLLRAVAEDWLQSAEHRPSTAEGARRQLELHVLPYLGDRAVGGLKRGDLQLWIKDRRKVLADSTVAIVYGRLKAVLTYAVHNDLITKNPCDGIPAPSVKRKEPTPPPTEVVAALIASAPSRYRAMVLLAAGSGLRHGELVGLERQHLDLDVGEVHVRQQAVRLDKGDPYIGQPKTDQSYRVVPLAKTVVEALSEHLRRFPPTAVVLDDRTDPRKPHRRTALLVFANANGRAINGGGWSRVWSNTVKRADAKLEKDGSKLRVPPGTSAHDLRHYYASLLILHRESVKTVQRRLGHAKPSVTLDVYTHLFEEVEDTTRDAVQDALKDISI